MYIKFYQRDGKLESTIELTNDNLKHIAGKMTKIVLKNGNSIVGYADPYRFEEKNSVFDNTIHDYIYLWQFKDLNNIQDGVNIDKVNISDIEVVHSILYSHPRWGSSITKKFWIDVE